MGVKNPQAREAILAFIKDFRQEYGISPSLTEIGEAVGLRSTSTVKYHLDELERRGKIRRGEGAKNRAIVPVGECCPTCGR